MTTRRTSGDHAGGEEFGGGDRDAGGGLDALDVQVEVRPDAGVGAGELTFDESFVGVQSDEQVEDRARRDPVGGCQCRGTEDRAERVEASLGVGAREQRRGCVGSELGGAGGDVGVELGLDELLEDADAASAVAIAEPPVTRTSRAPSSSMTVADRCSWDTSSSRSAPSRSASVSKRRVTTRNSS